MLSSLCSGAFSFVEVSTTLEAASSSLCFQFRRSEWHHQMDDNLGAFSFVKVSTTSEAASSSLLVLDLAEMGGVSQSLVDQSLYIAALLSLHVCMHVCVCVRAC